MSQIQANSVHADLIYSDGTSSFLDVLRICNQQVIGSSPIAGSTSNSLLESILRLHKNFQLAATGQLAAHLLPKIQSMQPNPEPHRSYGRRLFLRSCDAISGKAAFSDPQAVRVGILR